MLNIKWWFGDIPTSTHTYTLHFGAQNVEAYRMHRMFANVFVLFAGTLNVTAARDKLFFTLTDFKQNKTKQK